MPGADDAEEDEKLVTLPEYGGPVDMSLRAPFECAFKSGLAVVLLITVVLDKDDPIAEDDVIVVAPDGKLPLVDGSGLSKSANLEWEEVGAEVVLCFKSCTLLSSFLAT